ncbi:MAG TPA: C40 family peptidase, partial [Acidimicrobiales bacterium]|nr:C40 family peptidase [Acidimicrobiales bacterium]
QAAGPALAAPTGSRTLDDTAGGSSPTTPATAAGDVAPEAGYWLLTANGGVFTHGNLGFYGAAPGGSKTADAVDLVPTTDAKGYWMVTASGQVTAYGDAPTFGSASPALFGSPVKALVPTPDGMGYWLVTDNGGVFSYGNAQFFGSAFKAPGVSRVVSLTSTPDGRGYWITTDPGLVLPFGDAKSFGNGVATELRSPVAAMAVTPDGQGYWLATANGGVFSFGDARFFGSRPNAGADTDPVVSFAATPDGQGYWIVTRSGAVTAYGDAKALPNPQPDPLTGPVAALAVPRGGPIADIPVAFVVADHQAAATCPGLSWTVLAAIGKVESDFGRSTLAGVSSGTNSAGAAGPMQMGIDGAAGRTFQAYDHPVLADMAPTPSSGALPPSPYNLTDAVFAAARDLCSNGGASPANLRDAILAYNHSTSYADNVQTLTAVYGGLNASAPAAVRVAMTQLGVPYVWGGTAPNVGFDCSGLVQWAYRSVGIDLPRTSQQQWAALPHLPAGSTLEPGDLVFFGPADGPTHVGMFIGGGLMVDAPHTGSVVRVESYGWSDFLGAARA